MTLWIDGLKPEPAKSTEALFERLSQAFSPAAVARLRREMVRGKMPQSRGFYTEKNRNPRLSAALTMGYDGESLPRFAAFLQEYAAALHGAVLDVGCDNGVLTMAVGRMVPDSCILGIDRNRTAVRAAQTLCTGMTNVQFASEWPAAHFDAVLSVRTMHENFDQSGVQELEPLEAAGLRLAERMLDYARQLTERVAEGGVLISIERCRADQVLLGWLLALDRCGFGLGAHRQIDVLECGNPAQFHAMVLRRMQSGQAHVAQQFCELASPAQASGMLEGAQAEAYLMRCAGSCCYQFRAFSPDGLRMGRGGVWRNQKWTDQILLFQASPAGVRLQTWGVGREDEAVQAVRRAAEQARLAGYGINEDEYDG